MLGDMCSSRLRVDGMMHNAMGHDITFALNLFNYRIRFLP
jgi:hypothetical protein